MAILANRIKTRNNLLELLNFIFYSFKRLLPLSLTLLTCFIIYFPASTSSNIISNYAMEFNGRVVSIGGSIYRTIARNSSWISDKISYFQDLKTENLKLKLEIAKLKADNKLSQILIHENTILRDMLNVSQSAKHDFVTARVLGVSANPLSSGAIIEAGNNHGLQVDNIVINQEGLVGRVINVSDNFANVMLITDHNSRIPVITSISRTRGILAAQGDLLKIIYLPEDHNIQVGEKIYTSGDGKIYPYGLSVGEVSDVDANEVWVKTGISFSNMEFVLIALTAK